MDEQKEVCFNGCKRIKSEEETKNPSGASFLLYDSDTDRES